MPGGLSSFTRLSIKMLERCRAIMVEMIRGILSYSKNWIPFGTDGRRSRLSDGHLLSQFETHWMSHLILSAEILP
jgi:hypothetical protein